MTVAAIAGVTVASILSLLASNLLHSKFHNFVFSRKLAHGIAGCVILSALYLFNSPTVPLTLSALSFILLTATHTRLTFHGVQTKGRLSEVYFSGALVLCFLSWYFVNKEVGVAAALFMAFGDGITGMIRYPLYKTQFEKGWGGSIGMLVSCLLISLLITPYWVGAIAAVAVTLLERDKTLDDNITVPIGGLIILGAGSLYA